MDGIRPGCGAIVAMLETASGLKAFSVGKPSPVMLRAARKELALPTDQTVVIGDTMDTDILGGVQLNYKTILVLSGGTRREDLARYAYRPDKIVDSIADLDPAELERQYGAGLDSSLTPFHPSHRPRRKPAMTGVYSIPASEPGRTEPRSVSEGHTQARWTRLGFFCPRFTGRSEPHPRNPEREPAIPSPRTDEERHAERAARRPPTDRANPCSSAASPTGPASETRPITIGCRK